MGHHATVSRQDSTVPDGQILTRKFHQPGGLSRSFSETSLAVKRRPSHKLQVGEKFFCVNGSFVLPRKLIERVGKNCVFPRILGFSSSCLVAMQLNRSVYDLNVEIMEVLSYLSEVLDDKTRIYFFT